MVASRALFITICVALASVPALAAPAEGEGTLENYLDRTSLVRFSAGRLGSPSRDDSCLVLCSETKK